MAEHIVKNIKAFCLFATHFHELTTMEGQIPGVKNYYVSAISKDNQLMMQYKVKPGAVDRSYGIFVAKMLKFPEEIIKDAEQKAKELEKFEDFNADNEEEKDRDENMGQNGKREGQMDVEENDLISFAKRATLQMKHKVLAMVHSAVEKAKLVKNPEEKKALLKKLVQDIKNIEYES